MPYFMADTQCVVANIISVLFDNAHFFKKKKGYDAASMWRLETTKGERYLPDFPLAIYSMCTYDHLSTIDGW